MKTLLMGPTHSFFIVVGLQGQSWSNHNHPAPIHAKACFDFVIFDGVTPQPVAPEMLCNSQPQKLGGLQARGLLLLRTGWAALGVMVLTHSHIQALAGLPWDHQGYSAWLHLALILKQESLGVFSG